MKSIRLIVKLFLMTQVLCYAENIVKISTRTSPAIMPRTLLVMVVNTLPISRSIELQKTAMVSLPPTWKMLTLAQASWVTRMMHEYGDGTSDAIIFSDTMLAYQKQATILDDNVFYTSPIGKYEFVPFIKVHLNAEGYVDDGDANQMDASELLPILSRRYANFHSLPGSRLEAEWYAEPYYNASKRTLIFAAKMTTRDEINEGVILTQDFYAKAVLLGRGGYVKCEYFGFGINTPEAMSVAWREINSLADGVSYFPGSRYSNHLMWESQSSWDFLDLVEIDYRRKGMFRRSYPHVGNIAPLLVLVMILSGGIATWRRRDK